MAGARRLHTLFAREHNLLCDELRAHYRGLERRAGLPDGAPDRLRADRQDPHGRVDAGDPGHRGHRHGPARPTGTAPRPHDWLTRLGIWLIDSHASVGHPEDHAGPQRRAVLADRGLRHGLPDASAAARRLPVRRPPDRRGPRPPRRSSTSRARWPTRNCAAFGLENTLYSFGLSYPGAITLHNYPRSLQKFERNGELIDLSVVDLVRTRRRGVPRYNDFRAGLHKPRIRRWEELCEQPGVGAPDEGDLPQRRRGRHDGGPVRGDSAGGLRVLRHRLPHLHPDGLAAAAERPLPHRRLPPGDLLASSAWTGSRTTA